MSALPVLYSFRRCPYAMRARLALAVAGTPVELREVVLRNKPAALLAASAKATVPVLVLAGGSVVDESLAIMRWALEQTDPQHWLAHAPADAIGCVAQCDGPFKQALDRCKYPERFPQGAADLAWRQAQQWLEALEQRLGPHAQLGGARASWLDAAVFPLVRQFAAIDPPRWSALPLPALQVWLQGWAESALFASVMHKYPPWQDGDLPRVCFRP